MEMKKDGKNKLRMLYLKEILERRSDSEQGISHEEIMKQLKLKGIDVHPRTLRDDLYCLRDNAADFDMTIENNIPLGKSKAHPIKYMDYQASLQHNGSQAADGGCEGHPLYYSA